MNYSKTDLDNERKLVENAKNDPESFGILYERNYDQIFAYVLRRTADVLIAQDITSETFLKALKGLNSFKWQNVPFSAWLYRIALNEISMWLRKGSYKSSSLDGLKEKGYEPFSEQDLEEELINSQQQVERNEQYLAVHKKLEIIPEKYREVISLRFFADKQVNEIAQILSKPEGTVKSLLHRGLEKLKKEMSLASQNATFYEHEHYGVQRTDENDQ